MSSSQLQPSPSSREYATFFKVPTSSKVPRRQSAPLLSRLFLWYADDMMRVGNAKEGGYLEKLGV
ncbi:hypothetical protein DVH05_020827 [Phytophthora capsici]|nr:hypothetical protein DVH05_020827 [Phytophthora capsici]